MPTFSLVTAVATVDGPNLAELLAERDVHVLALDGGDATDKASALAMAQRDLPDVPDLMVHNWDALADYLWNVLYDVPTDEVALVLGDAHVLAAHDLQTLLEFVGVVRDVARSVSDGSGGFPRHTTLRLFLVGDGPAYRPLADA